MGRAPCCSKVGLHRGPWTPREDALLTKYIQLHGEGQWRSLPKRAGLLRCGKSCRLRWMNYLRPDIKRGNITAEEDDLIIRMHSLLGNRWSLIAGRLPGRTDNEIKNYWNTHLSKKFMKNQQTTEDPNTHNKKKNNPSSRRKKNNNNTNKQKSCGSDMDDDDKGGNTDTNKKNMTTVYLPKPIRVVAVNLSNLLLSSSSSLSSIPRIDSITTASFTLDESNNNSGSASSTTRSHDKLEGCQQQDDEEQELNNMVWGVLGSDEGENNDGFKLLGGEGEQDHHRHDDLLVYGCDDEMESQSYYSDIGRDDGTLEKLYDEYFQLLNMDSFAESLLV